MQKSQKRGKLGNELSRWRKEPTGKYLKKETARKSDAWIRKGRTRARVVCDGEVAWPDQA